MLPEAVIFVVDILPLFKMSPEAVILPSEPVAIKLRPVMFPLALTLPLTLKESPTVKSSDNIMSSAYIVPEALMFDAVMSPITCK